MKRFISVLSSTKLMTGLLILFAFSIGLATFIERDFGTDSARALIYNAKWFEILLVLGAINILAVMINTGMFRRSKLTMLAFHLSFLLIIAGAGITRYFGGEGSMHIREGYETANWITTQDYIEVVIQDDEGVVSKEYPVLFASAAKDRFSKKIRYSGNRISIKMTGYIPNAERALFADPEGQASIHMVTATGQGREDVLFFMGQSLNTGGFTLTYVEQPDTIKNTSTVQLFDREGAICFLAPFTVTRVAMQGDQNLALQANTVHPFIPSMLYYFDEIPFVLKQYLPAARIDAQPSSLQVENPLHALRMQVSVNGITSSLAVFGKDNEEGRFSMITIDGIEIALKYGPVRRQLPFRLRLNDFIIKRYPGSQSPSWYESNVQLMDPANELSQAKRIYMNHILKYRGYRFYQSSYDADEKGTILSINRDSAGTTITYLGYLLMGLGMVLSLVNRKSRFIKLAARKGVVNISTKLFLAGLLLSLSIGAFAEESSDAKDSLVPREKAKEFGTLLVQDNSGRIKPVNTLASEFLRKISRKENLDGMSPMQVIMGMISNPAYWQKKDMIKVGHSEIQDILSIESKYAAYTDFFSIENGSYKLKPYIEKAYRKSPSLRSKFDNELIRLDERLNVAYMIYSGNAFRMFPDPVDTNYTWHSPISAADAFTGEDSLFTTNIMGYYAEEIRNSLETGTWKRVDETVEAIRVFQTRYGVEVLPENSRIKAEIFYYNSNLLNYVTRIYLLIGFLLLLFQFIHIFLPRFSMRWIYRISFLLIAISFAAHTFSLGLRWYVSGHAPWSNGYEALTFIAWASVFAGFIFSGKSRIALSTTTVLAALILQTAHLAWMDPQITNLVPVLQSYWLIIHVAVITASYAFLGLAALISAVNLLLMFFQNRKNYLRFEDQISQLSGVIEMALIVGLYLLSIGTFLGGVWANESWGRYWAWDPKETWALVTLIVYALILHLRLVPGLKGRVLFNGLALAGFSSVLMTYFGVNYYLSGLHSYAKGEAIPVPPLVYYSIVTVILLILLAAYNQNRLKKGANS